ncbi:MAG TPA: anti-sigma factor [Myxococcales bacterium]|jgi:anti-sigma factor RsiW|nr:anti-sigma factor [Myxococcales bacterium]
MTCIETRRLLGAYVDNELDLRGAVEIEEHVGRCPGCGSEERQLRELQASVRTNLIRHEPAPAFEARLRDALRVEGLQTLAEATPPAPTPRRRRALRWTALAPLSAAAAVLMVVALPRLWPRPSDASVADAVIAAHVRSMLANHLTDVASSDQHTVKPWFQGKLDYSVSVSDWAAEGFPLVGGRLDYVEDTPAAALVYRRAQHVVNLFVWPSKRASVDPLQHLARRGYSAYWWTKDGMHYWAVSDLNEPELQKFVELVRRRE